jgi:hypothetical protein
MQGLSEEELEDAKSRLKGARIVCALMCPVHYRSRAEAGEVIENAVERLEVIDETDHEVLLGFRADSTLINALSTAFLSIVLFVLQQLFLQNIPGL